MPLNEFNDYVLAMDKIEAREVLLAIKVSSYPYQVKKDRDALHEQFKKISELDSHDEAEQLDATEIAKILGMI